MRVLDPETETASGAAEYGAKCGDTPATAATPPRDYSCNQQQATDNNTAAASFPPHVLLASEEDLISFCGRPSNLTPSSSSASASKDDDPSSTKKESNRVVAFGILAEIASRGLLRYKWDHVKLLFILLLETRMRERKETESTVVEVGPSQAQDTKQADFERLRGLIKSFRHYPFTAQRIAEVLLLGGECYSSWEKLVWALEKCLLVTETVKQHETDRCPPLPRMAELEKEVKDLRLALIKARPEGPDKRQQHRKKNFPTNTSAAASAGHHHQHSHSPNRGGVQVEPLSMPMMSGGPELGQQQSQLQLEPQPSGPQVVGAPGVDWYEEDSSRRAMGHGLKQHVASASSAQHQLQSTSADDWEERNMGRARDVNRRVVDLDHVVDHSPMISLANLNKNNGEIVADVRGSHSHSHPAPQVLEMHGTAAAVPYGTPLVHESLDLVASRPQPAHNAATYLDTTNQSMMLESPQKKHKMNSEEINSEA